MPFPLLIILLTVATYAQTSLHDERDGKTYKTVKIGTQTWMAENLNYNALGSKCYGEDGEIVMGFDEEKREHVYVQLSDNEIKANCVKYGRLYNFATAMGLPYNCNASVCTSQNVKYQGICPEGWHIPSNAEWDKLVQYADDASSMQGILPYESYSAGSHLKATNGWSDDEGKPANGTDKYGFAALPGGYYNNETGRFNLINRQGFWWTTEEYNEKYMEILCATVYDHCGYDEPVDGNDYAYYRRIYSDGKILWSHQEKNTMLSVRCVKD